MRASTTSCHCSNGCGSIGYSVTFHRGSLALRLREWLPHHRNPCAVGTRHWQSLRIPIPRSHRVLALLLASRESIKSAKYDSWPRDRADLRLWGIRTHRCRVYTFRGASWHLLAKDPCRGIIALCHGRVHVTARCQPSACRCDNVDRFSWDHRKTPRTRRHRGGGVSARGSSSLDQQACRITLPILESSS